jgi:hypothetical protein
MGMGDGSKKLAFEAIPVTLLLPYFAGWQNPGDKPRIVLLTGAALF